MRIDIGTFTGESTLNINNNHVQRREEQENSRTIEKKNFEWQFKPNHINCENFETKTVHIEQK